MTNNMTYQTMIIEVASIEHSKQPILVCCFDVVVSISPSFCRREYIIRLLIK